MAIADRSKDLVKSGGEWISSVDLENSIMALHLGRTGKRQCVMYAGWGPGALAWAAQDLGMPVELIGEETQCASEGHAHCVFEVKKV